MTCPPGEFVNGGSCTSCSSGTYKAGTNTRTSCDTCPLPFIRTSGTDQDDITDCHREFDLTFTDSNAVTMTTKVDLYYNTPRAQWINTVMTSPSSGWSPFGPCNAFNLNYWGTGSSEMTSIGQTRTSVDSIYQSNSPCHAFEYRLRVEVISNTCVNVQSQYRNRDLGSSYSNYENHGNICEP